MILALLLCAPLASASDIELGWIPNPGPSESPALILTPSRATTLIEVSCEVGGKTIARQLKGVKGGAAQRITFPRDPKVTSATCFVRAIYPDDFVDEFDVPLEWSFSAPLSVDLSRAQADVKDRTLTVRVSTAVDSADITAYGARKVVLDQRTVELSGGPGEVIVPWVGDPKDVVLLDITVRSGGAWAGFTYSPWFLDIPHEDVLFDSASDKIEGAEEWKLESSLKELRDVLDKYGDIVPVKLYIAGCTDTVGDGTYNKDLSRRRARAIASWLRAHGYDKPIFYYGFGEGLLSVQTGDGVDNAANRRALYLVGANPPPSGSGVPSVGWVEL